MKTEKRWEEIPNSSTEIIYCGENEETGHTKGDFINMVNGNEYLAKIVFQLCEWQYPRTIIDELIREGEIDEKFNFIQTSH